MARNYPRELSHWLSKPTIRKLLPLAPSICLDGERGYLNVVTKKVVIAKIGAPFGVKGWVHVQSFTQPIKNCLNYPIWYLFKQGVWEPREVSESQVHHQGIVVRFKDIVTREDAAHLRLLEVGVDRENLPQLPKGEFYWTDLEGLAVEDIDGQLLGTVGWLYQHTDLDVMVVKEEKKERHIPFILEDVVQKVDLELKKIVVDWKPL